MRISDHNQEPRPRQRGYKAPIVGIAGNDNEGVDFILVVLLTGPRRQPDIHQRLILLDPLDSDVFHRNTGELLQDAPS